MAVIRRTLTGGHRRAAQQEQERLLSAVAEKHRPRLEAALQAAVVAGVRSFREHGLPDQIDLGTHREDLEKIWLAMAAETAVLFASVIDQQAKQLWPGLETKRAPGEVGSLADAEFLKEMHRRKITNVADTTRKQIVEALRRGYRAGLGVDEIAKVVQRDGAAMSKLRAHTIARTETHLASQAATHEVAKGYSRGNAVLEAKREWVSAEDHRTRPAHVVADGQVRGMDEPFTVDDEQLMFPGDPAGSAGNVINCRCTVAVILEEVRADDPLAFTRKSTLSDAVKLDGNGMADTTNIAGLPDRVADFDSKATGLKLWRDNPRFQQQVYKAEAGQTAPPVAHAFLALMDEASRETTRMHRVTYLSDVAKTIRPGELFTITRTTSFTDDAALAVQIGAASASKAGVPVLIEARGQAVPVDKLLSGLGLRGSSPALGEWLTRRNQTFTIETVEDANLSDLPNALRITVKEVTE